MIFPFLKYINPVWYFNLSTGSRIPYFPDYDVLDERDKKLIEWDGQYSQREVSKLDAAYQAWNKGVIFMEDKKSFGYQTIATSVSDNYRFVQKYFHPLWSVYVLVLRILTFHNPFKEVAAFWSQRKVKRLNIYASVANYETAISQFHSTLLAGQPRVAVIIPTLNRYPWLADALKDLEQQDYKNFEVIVVDQSEPFEPEFYDQFASEIKLIRQEEKALWLARNTAIQSTDTEYLLLYDDDSRTEPNWISEHLKCLDYFQADISSGVSLSVIGAKVPQNYAFYRWSDQLDTGNAMVKRAVFREIGLFDRQFEKQRMGDGEFGLRAYLAGFKNISNPVAKRVHLKVGEGGLRQMGSWDGWRPKSWWAPRPVPSVLYLIRKYFGRKAAFRVMFLNLPQSLIPYKFKGNIMYIAILFPLFLIYFPLLFIQGMRSWSSSSEMLRQGTKIEPLA